MNKVIGKLNRLEFKIDEQNEICETNTAAFKDYKNCFLGKKVVIVGTGPTAKYYKPIPDAIHIALNYAWRREDISFDYLFTADSSAKDIAQGFDKINKKIFIGKFPRYHVLSYREFPESFSMIKNVSRYYGNNPVPTQHIFQNICTHPIYSQCTVAFSALHFALFTYPKEIYLVGCDTTREGYFYDEQKENFLALDKIKIGYGRMKMFATQYYPDTKIISVNPVGLTGLFEDIYTEDFLKK